MPQSLLDFDARCPTPTAWGKAQSSFAKLVFQLCELCVNAFVFESATCKIFSQKQPKSALSSPRAPTHLRNLNKSNPIPAKKSWHVYPLPLAILKLWGQYIPAEASTPSASDL
jgi:hypothetical protein